MLFCSVCLLSSDMCTSVHLSERFYICSTHTNEKYTCNENILHQYFGFLSTPKQKRLCIGPFSMSHFTRTKLYFRWSEKFFFRIGSDLSSFFLFSFIANLNEKCRPIKANISLPLSRSKLLFSFRELHTHALTDCVGFFALFQKHTNQFVEKYFASHLMNFSKKLSIEISLWKHIF